MKAVVVGASSGLGRCIGVDLGRRGDQVALLARRHDRLVDAAKEAGPDALAVACDVTDESSCRAAIEEAAAGLGGIDALVYATGIGPLAPVEKLDADAWRRAMDTNVIGAALVTSAALPHLTKSGGVAAYLSSIGGSLTPSWPGFAAYHVSKAALEKLVEAFRVEHPSVGFTRFVVGDCAGGEGDSRTGFTDGWDRGVRGPGPPGLAAARLSDGRPAGRGRVPPCARRRTALRRHRPGGDGDAAPARPGPRRPGPDSEDGP
ncbi:SDR family oxidoreductase [Streptomyces sp. NBC_01549]|uniref:SDR family oxidoreductase n=1 Tax=Streptomyces sp. NBC_01549 TaxID=2975874 RepID=UPI002257E0EB|nr:SDR family oxidoreductase [Streptomyces sp. NBC_01549]MCX4592191.1 SDR family oxidoreductase [Streptomyces sp. NBC_01549]